MKKVLRKISMLDELAKEMLVLSKSEQKRFIGGNDTTYGGYGPILNGFCFFNCLEYLNDYYKGDSDINYYMNAYGSSYGNDQVLFGPSNFSEITDFVNNNFTTAGATFSPYIIMQTINYNPVLGIIPTPNSGELHAVIIQSYNEHNNTFSYYDPTSTSYNTIDANTVIYGIGVTGL
jgi:hypothetical protein